MSISEVTITLCKRCGTEIFVGQDEVCPVCGVKLLPNGDIDHSWTEADYENYKNKKEQERIALIEQKHLEFIRKQKKQQISNRLIASAVFVVLLIIFGLLSFVSRVFDGLAITTLLVFIGLLTSWARG